MKPNPPTSTSFTVGPGSGRTQNQSHHARAPSSSTTGMSSSHFKPSLELPQIPTSSFMDSFGSSEVGQGGMGLDMPLLPLGSSSTSPLTRNDGRSARNEQGRLGSGLGGSSTGGPRPRVLSARELDSNSTTTATSFDRSTGQSNSSFPASSTSTAQADPSARTLNGQRAGSPKASRTYRSDGRTGLGVAATPAGPSTTINRSPLKGNADRSSLMSTTGMSASASTSAAAGAGVTASSSARRPPPERLDLESPGRGAYYRSSTAVVGGRDTGERRRVVTEPGQGSMFDSRHSHLFYTGENRYPDSTATTATSTTTSFDRDSTHLPHSPSLPLSAFGFGALRDGGAGGSGSAEAVVDENTMLPPIPRSLSMHLAGEKRKGGSMVDGPDGRGSLEAYYARQSPPRQLAPSGSHAHLRTPSAKFGPGHFHNYLQSPSTPGPPDPSTLNRDDLVGVGELSTPRWRSPSNTYQTPMGTYGQDVRSAVPDTISKSSMTGQIKGALFPSRRTKSIANSESYGSLMADDIGHPVPNLPSTLAMPPTATMDGTLGRHGSGRVQGPRLRIPSGPAARVVSGSRSATTHASGRESGTSDQDARRADLPPQIGLGVRLGGEESLESMFANGDSLSPNPFDATRVSPARKERPATPPRGSSRLWNDNDASPSSLRGTRRYSNRVAADLQALKVKEASRLAQSVGHVQEEDVSTMTLSPIDAQSNSAPGSNYSSPKKGNYVDSPGRPRLLSETSLDRNGFPLRPDKSDQRKTPPSGYKRETRLSSSQAKSPNEYPHAGTILKQLGSHRDFSHLPPSPSSASINKFMMRESASVGSFSPGSTPAEKVTESGTAHYPFPQVGADDLDPQSRHSKRRRDQHGESEYSSRRSMNKETAEALRKLDGLGKASSNSLKKQAKQDSLGNGILERQRTHSREPSSQKHSTEPTRFPSAPSTPSSPDTSKSTRTSMGSTGPSSATAFSISLDQQVHGTKDGHRSSFSSLTNADDLGQHKDQVQARVPPVPPLPNDYQLKQTGLVKSPTLDRLPRPSEYATVKDNSSTKVLGPSEKGMSHSASSPILSSDASYHSADSRSPAMSSFSALDPGQPDVQRPPRMSKKWSFSSALSLASLGHKGKTEASTSTAAAHNEKSGPIDDFGQETGRDTRQQSGNLRVPVMHDGLTTATGSPGQNNASLPPIAPDTGLTVPTDPRLSTHPRRSTSSGIPFFRRSSSSSSTALALGTTNTGKSNQQQYTRDPHDTASSGTQHQNNRKTILGVGMSLLKGSSSRRNLNHRPSQEHLQSNSLLTPAAERPKHERKGSIGWSRKRNKNSDDTSAGLPSPVESLGTLQDESLSRNSSVQRKFSQESIQSSTGLNPTTPVHGRTSNLRTGPAATMQTSRSGLLPSIAGSPVVQSKSKAASPSPSNRQTQARTLSSATPTKIPRMASRTSLVNSIGLPGPSAPMPTKSGTAHSLPVSRERTVTGPAAVSGSMLAELGYGSVDKSRVGTRRLAKNGTMDLPRTDQSPTSQSSQTTIVANGKPSETQKRDLPLPPDNAVPTSTNRTNKALPRDLSAGSLRRTSITGINSGNGANPAATPSKSDGIPSRLAVPGYARIPHSSSASNLSGRSSRSQSPQTSVLDDDEMKGNDEMASFFRRQKAKQARGEIKNSEIEAMLNFPDPMAAGSELSPHAFIKTHFDSLSLYERREILDYQSIWYSGQNGKKNQATPESTTNNHGYDDERGDYIHIHGDHLAYRYEIMCLLGKGSFGQVLQCRDHKTGQCVAIKIIRNKKRFHHQALVEVKILENLVKWDPEDKHNLIKINQHFYFRGHLCIVTELLSINLYEMVKANSFVGFSTTLIRRFTVQLLSSLQIMRNNRIIHCDLKPENILLRHPAKSGLKVIDFGSSCFEHEKVYTYIQSRFYRSPEIILGCSYHSAIDMWSLGCIIAELYTGFPIFPGENEQEQLACIMEVMGLPDKAMVEKSTRKKNFFDSFGQPKIVPNSKGKRRRPGAKTLQQVLKADDELFVDFIAKCLIWDPEKRLKPMAAMKHPWITGVRRMPVSNAPPASAIHSRLSSITSTPSSRRSGGESSKPRISEPSPLTARKTNSGLPASSSGTFTSQSSRIARPSQFSSSRSIAQTAGR